MTYDEIRKVPLHARKNANGDNIHCDLYGGDWPLYDYIVELAHDWSRLNDLPGPINLSDEFVSKLEEKIGCAFWSTFRALNYIGERPANENENQLDMGFHALRYYLGKREVKTSNRDFACQILSLAVERMRLETDAKEASSWLHAYCDQSLTRLLDYCVYYGIDHQGVIRKTYEKQY